MVTVPAVPPKTAVSRLEFVHEELAPPNWRVSQFVVVPASSSQLPEPPLALALVSLPSQYRVAPVAAEREQATSDKAAAKRAIRQDFGFI